MKLSQKITPQSSISIQHQYVRNKNKKLAFQRTYQLYMLVCLVAETPCLERMASEHTCVKIPLQIFQKFKRQHAAKKDAAQLWLFIFLGVWPPLSPHIKIFIGQYYSPVVRKLSSESHHDLNRMVVFHTTLVKIKGPQH